MSLSAHKSPSTLIQYDECMKFFKPSQTTQHTKHNAARNARHYSARSGENAHEYIAQGYHQNKSFEALSRDAYMTHAVTSRGRHKSTLWTIVLIIACLVFVVSVSVLGLIGYGYWHGTQLYDSVAQKASLDPHQDTLADMTINWDALTQENPDTVAWIYMPGTAINYPVVQGKNDEEYLTKDFSGSSDGLVHKGTIFLAADNKSDFSDQNNFLYGHNMNDNTMFAPLIGFEKQDEFDAHREFYILTPTKNYKVKSFALDIIKATDTPVLQMGFPSEESFKAYIDARIKGATSYASDLTISDITKLFTLITCGDDYAATRAILCGAVVEEAIPANTTSTSIQTHA